MPGPKSADQLKEKKAKRSGVSVIERGAMQHAKSSRLSNYLEQFPRKSPLFVEITPLEIKQATNCLSNSYQVDEMAVPSYLHGNPLIRWLFWGRLHHALNFLKPDAGDILWEFGSGSGILLPSLSKASLRVFSTDLFPDPAQRMVSARKLTNVVVGERIDDLTADRSINGIIALDVLEHVDDLEQTITAFKRKLAPGGRVIVCGPTESWLYKLGRILAGFAGKGDYHHTNILEISKQFEHLGFVPVSQVRIFPWPFPCLFQIFDYRLSS